MKRIGEVIGYIVFAVIVLGSVALDFYVLIRWGLRGFIALLVVEGFVLPLLFTVTALIGAGLYSLGAGVVGLFRQGHKV